jgi:hypothetical protein
LSCCLSCRAAGGRDAVLVASLFDAGAVAAASALGGKRNSWRHLGQTNPRRANFSANRSFEPQLGQLTSIDMRPLWSSNSAK